MARILVADDEESIREMLKDALEMCGYGVDTAADGTMAVQMLREAPYDLVLLDRNMPKMDGLQALVAIRRDSSPKLRGMRVIMCTGAATGREIDESFAAGATDYLPKPIDLKTLFAKVEKTLKR